MKLTKEIKDGKVVFGLELDDADLALFAHVHLSHTTLGRAGVYRDAPNLAHALLNLTEARYGSATVYSDSLYELTRESTGKPVEKAAENLAHNVRRIKEMIDNEHSKCGTAFVVI